MKLMLEYYNRNLTETLLIRFITLCYLALILDPDHGNKPFVRNVGTILQVYAALRSRSMRTSQILEDGENCILKRVIICTPIQISLRTPNRGIERRRI
jgi:hypothetical protein